MFTIHDLCPSVISTMLVDADLSNEQRVVLCEQYERLTGTAWGNGAVVQKAINTLNKDDCELIATYSRDISPTSLAIIVRENIPEGGQRMTARQKEFWARFGEELGPDWIDGLRHVAGFIKKMDEF